MAPVFSASSRPGAKSLPVLNLCCSQFSQRAGRSADDTASVAAYNILKLQPLISAPLSLTVNEFNYCSQFMQTKNSQMSKTTCAFYYYWLLLAFSLK